MNTYLLLKTLHILSSVLMVVAAFVSKAALSNFIDTTRLSTPLIWSPPSRDLRSRSRIWGPWPD